MVCPAVHIKFDVVFGLTASRNFWCNPSVTGRIGGINNNKFVRKDLSIRSNICSAAYFLR